MKAPADSRRRGDLEVAVLGGVLERVDAGLRRAVRVGRRPRLREDEDVAALVVRLRIRRLGRLLGALHDPEPPVRHPAARPPCGTSADGHVVPACGQSSRQLDLDPVALGRPRLELAHAPGGDDAAARAVLALAQRDHEPRTRRLAGVVADLDGEPEVIAREGPLRERADRAQLRRRLHRVGGPGHRRGRQREAEDDNDSDNPTACGRHGPLLLRNVTQQRPRPAVVPRGARYPVRRARAQRV